MVIRIIRYWDKTLRSIQPKSCVKGKKILKEHYIEESDIGS